MNDQTKAPPTAYSKWYEGHKATLSEKRKARYANDPAYRDKAKANRAKQLAKTRSTTTLPEEYTTTFSDAAQELGVSIWKFRYWRQLGYFPEPKQHGKCLYFTDAQVDLLQALQDFLEEYKRLPGSAKAELTALTTLIHTNWNA